LILLHGVQEAVEWGKYILASNIFKMLEAGIKMFELAWKYFKPMKTRN